MDYYCLYLPLVFRTNRCNTWCSKQVIIDCAVVTNMTLTAVKPESLHGVCIQDVHVVTMSDWWLIAWYSGSSHTNIGANEHD